jgi:hypothetical protein
LPSVVCNSKISARTACFCHHHPPVLAPQGTWGCLAHTSAHVCIHLATIAYTRTRYAVRPPLPTTATAPIGLAQHSKRRCLGLPAASYTRLFLAARPCRPFCALAAFAMLACTYARCDRGQVISCWASWHVEHVSKVGCAGAYPSYPNTKYKGSRLATIRQVVQPAGRLQAPHHSGSDIYATCKQARTSLTSVTHKVWLRLRAHELTQER